MAAEIDEREQQRRVNDFYNRGLRALETNQHDYAIHFFHSALELDPNFSRAHEGIRLVRKAKYQRGSVASQRMRCIGFLIKGYVFERMGKWQKALENFENLLSLMRPPVQLYPHMGDAYWGNHMTEKAITYYRATLEQDASNIYTLRQMGRLLLELGNMRDARPVYDCLAELVGSDGIMLKEVKDAYATMAISTGHWEEEGGFRRSVADEGASGQAAVEEVEDEEAKKYSKPIRMAMSEVRSEPENALKRQHLARLLEGEGYIEAAMEQLQSVKPLRPDDMDIRRKLADLYSSQEQYGKAAEEYEEILSKAPDLECRRMLAKTYEKQDNSEKAIEAYKQLTEEQPEDADAFERLAGLYARSRYFDEAADAYERVVALRPDRADMHETLGNLYQRRGIMDKAMVLYQKVVELVPDNLEVQTSLGEIYLQKAMMKEAQACFEKLLELDPESTAARGRLREIEIALVEGEVKRCEARLKKTPDDEKLQEAYKDVRRRRAGLLVMDREERVARASDNTKARFELGVLYHEQGELDRALEQFQQCSQDDSFRTQALNMIGLCFEGKGMFDLAVEQLEQASSLVSKMTEEKKEILYNLGRVYEQMQQVEKAMDQYKKIYAVDISYRNVSHKIQEAYQK